MRIFVAKEYHKFIRDHKTINSELKRSLAKHPKSDEFINNITNQFKHVQFLRLKKGKKKIGDKTLAEAIHDFAELLITAIEKKANEAMESEVAKYQRIHAGDDLKDMQSTLEGKSVAAFEDMGLVIPEDQQDQTENHIKEPIPEGRVITYAKGK